MQYLHTMLRGAISSSRSISSATSSASRRSLPRHPEGRYTLVFLAAPADADAARKRKAPMIELTHN
jgi:lactoylglutathione lyase